MLQYHKKLTSHACHFDQVLFQNNIDMEERGDENVIFFSKWLKIFVSDCLFLEGMQSVLFTTQQNRPALDDTFVTPNSFYPNFTIKIHNVRSCTPSFKI